MNKFEDSSANISDCVHGYYTVGTKYYNKKFNALIEASRTKTQAQWHFSPDAYASAIRLPQLNSSLDELYIQRAKQLREQYDYLILGYSGGSDSDNILQIFLDNNIKIDELWCDFPLTLINKSGYVLNYSHDASNMASEWFLVIEPELRRISQQYPQIKIHCSDSFESPSVEDFEDTVTVMSQPSAYTSIKRYRYIENYMTELNSGGRRAALILGMDKPYLYMWKNSYGFYFVDTSTYCKSNITADKKFIVEYFYWTPHFPQITVEQARRAWTYLLGNPEFAKQRILEHQKSLYNWMDRSVGFDNIIKKICYSRWDHTKHQVNKTGVFYNLQFSPFLDSITHTPYIQSYQSNVRTMLQTLDPAFAYQNGKDLKDDLKIFFSFHPLGQVDWNLELPNVL